MENIFTDMKSGKLYPDPLGMTLFCGSLKRGDNPEIYSFIDTQYDTFPLHIQQFLMRVLCNYEFYHPIILKHPNDWNKSVFHILERKDVVMDNIDLS